MSDSALRKYVCSSCGNELACAVSEVTVMGPSAPITMALFPKCMNPAHTPRLMDERALPPDTPPVVAVPEEDLGVPS